MCFFEQDSLNRFIDQRQGVDLHVFATSAASQVHLAVTQSELLDSVNTFNRLGGLFSALTASSPIWAGSVDKDWLDIREIFWDKCWTNRIEQVGIPEDFKTVDDYLNKILSFRPQMVKRDGEFIKITSAKTVGGFVKKASENFGETVNGERVSLDSKLDDVFFHIGFAWWQARLVPGYGTLEVRSVGQQPPGDVLAPAALSLGLLENLSKAKKLANRLSYKEWVALRFDALRHGLKAESGGKSVVGLVGEMIEVSEEGLVTRGLGEEKYLESLKKRLKNKRTPADESIAAFEKGGIESLIELVRFK